MDGNGIHDLLPLFLEEAGERVERIAGLVSSVDDDLAAAAELRRELHALKGASRMMGLEDLSDLCHHAEDLASPGETGRGEELAKRCTEIAAAIERLSGAAAAPPVAAPRHPRRRGRPRDEMRVPASLVDDLADRGARLRVIAVGAEGLADRIFRLATLAERGVSDRSPQQVLATLATSLRQVGLDLEGGQRVFRRLTDRQLETLLRLQVQPLRPFMRFLANHARDLAKTLEKKIEVIVDAGDTQLDRRISNTLREAFLHLVRNAVDHGLEAPEERAQRGKDETGTLWIEASAEGDRVRLEVRDDGRGIDPAGVLATAVERGVIGADEAQGLSDDEAVRLLMLPGFSTRDEASQLSGRGVGLDAVLAAVSSVGGDLRVVSNPGAGTCVTVEVPVARRGDRVLVVRVGEHFLALPSAPVQAFRKVAPENVVDHGGRPALRIGEELVAARLLSDLGAAGASDGVLVETMVGGAVLGLVVDDVVGGEEVIIRAIPKAAGAPEGVEGITLLSSGRPVAVLSLQRFAAAFGGDLDLGAGGRERVRPVRVLLVDDSDVTREMVRRLLEDSGINVVGVGNAEEALRRLEAQDFDCIVTDIEMPGMDGLGLTRKIRGSFGTAYSDLPIVVVSTLDRPADRLAGLEAGADAYLTKQGLDARELVALVYRVAGDG